MLISCGEASISSPSYTPFLEQSPDITKFLLNDQEKNIYILTKNNSKEIELFFINSNNEIEKKTFNPIDQNKIKKSNEGHFDEVQSFIESNKLKPRKDSIKGLINRAKKDIEYSLGFFDTSHYGLDPNNNEQAKPLIDIVKTATKKDGAGTLKYIENYKLDIVIEKIEKKEGGKY